MATHTDLENINFERENSGHSSIENTVMQPAQMLSNPDPSSAGIQSSRLLWIQLLQTLKSPASARQQWQVLAYLKANPQIVASFIKHRTAQQLQLLMQQQQQLHQQQQQVLAILNANSQLDAVRKQRKIHIQQQHELVPQQQCQMLQKKGNMTENHTMRPQQLLPNPHPSIADMQNSAPAWNQLLETSKSPASVQQQQQYLAILQDNPHLIPQASPQLLATHITQRTDQQLQQHQLFQQIPQQIQLYHHQLQQNQQQRQPGGPQRRLSQRQQRRQMIRM